MNGEYDIDVLEPPGYDEAARVLLKRALIVILSPEWGKPANVPQAQQVGESENEVIANVEEPTTVS